MFTQKKAARGDLCVHNEYSSLWHTLIKPLHSPKIFRQSTRQHQGFTVTNCCFLLLGLSGMDNFNKPRSTIGKMCLVIR